jgi:1,4-dihydroxy-2-naphthoate octaprenyltransferase
MKNTMQRKDSPDNNQLSTPKEKVDASSQIITAETVQAEEVPTIPLGSLQTVGTLQPEISVRSAASTRSVSLPKPLVAQPQEYHPGVGEWLTIWWDGIRPAYFPLSVIPVVLGSIVAWTQSISPQHPRGDFHPIRFIVTLAAVLLLQTGAHLINDYYDYLKNVDRSNSLGPGGLIQQGLVRPDQVLSFGLISLGSGAFLGAFAAISGGWLILVFGLLGLLAAYFYSGTSRALSSLALGELVSFCIFGPLLTLGAYMVQTGHMDRTVFLYSISLGLLATASIHLNNMRDAESDAQAGKHTLASILGGPLSRALYLVLVLGAYAPIIALALPRHAPHLLLLVLWTLPGLVIAIMGVFCTFNPASLHLAMRQTLKLETYFTLFLVIALIVTAVIPILPHLPSLSLPF